MRILPLVFVSVSTLVMPALVRAGESSPWLDPSNGCGRAATFAESQRAADLPGCTGRLPKNPPQVEQLLHDVKRKLVDAEDYLRKGKLERIDPLLAEAESALATVPQVHPELPDRWEQAEPLYKKEIAALRNRRKLAPLLDGLRSSHKAALEADKTRNKRELRGGPAEALKAAQACGAQFAEVKAAGIELATTVELDKDHPRPLAELSAECERVRHTAAELVAAQDKADKARRAQFRKAVRGDRLKALDAHPTSLPEIEGGEDNWRSVAKGPTWKYRTAEGFEIYTFRGNKLVAKRKAPLK
jgi:hypothetical protein